MQDHSDWYRLFTGYWWLLFPILAMVWGMVDLMARHRRANHGLDLVKSYVDQGKEPPPELLTFLQKPIVREKRGQDVGAYFIYAGLVFAVLTVAFCALTLMLWSQDGHVESGLVFVIVLMAGFAVANFVASRVADRSGSRLPPS